MAGPELATRRARATATLLPDGRVLIAGGGTLLNGLPLDAPAAELFR